MPAYNAANYIAESIESVINQSYPYWELLVVDDGSTDDTAAIIKRFELTDQRVKYLFQQNGRQGKARNLGIQNSGGKYIAFLDADDKWTSDKLTIQTKLLSADTNTDLHFAQGYSLTGNQVEDYDVDVKPIWNSNNFIDFVQQNRIPILSVLIKKEALLQAGGFTEDENIQNVEDYHLWLKLLISNKVFKSTADRLFYYRIHTNQSTFQNQNTAAPIFHVYGNLLKTCQDDKVGQILMGKLKWYIFRPEFHAECLEIIITHLNNKGKALIAFIIKKLFAGPAYIQQKLAFKLVSVFG
ncbi:glycosyltransferase family 2 protein [Mucilaginibacter ginsenosidivorax]|uniref:Glycosyltransferase family 2 protein n=1 Tax=Mucilaginibacter ginsenosidivorax TaxID=862126 RepID=A0A5B8W6P9_9SPHI|nr:glycosyltransferase family A protein [Mucilaginibacter ginsenosidivorax]QEC77928.1 glycosyltransferase family 2 protein [Mucilaginibacter ginsenosidivorax]